MLRRFGLLMGQSYSVCLFRGYASFAHSGCLPTTAERSVKGNHAQQFVQASLGEGQFGREKFLLVVNDFEVAGHTALVAYRGEIGGFAVGLSALFQPDAKLAIALVGDKSVGNFAKCVLRGLLVSEQGLVILSFGDLQVGAQTSAG